MTDSILLLGVVIFAATRREPRAIGVVGAVTRGLSLYAVWLVMNLFWIISVATYVGAETARGLAVRDPLELFKKNSAPFGEAIRLTGYWAVSDTAAGSPYFPWYEYFAKVGARAAFAVPVIAIIGVLAVVGSRHCLASPAHNRATAPTIREYFAFFAVMLVGALTLMTGAHAPFGTIKASLVDSVGLTGPFRSVYQRFGIYAAIAYVPLIAVGIWVLRRRLGARFGPVVGLLAAVAAVVAVAVVPALPLWTGNAFDRSGNNASRRITVPDDYRRVAQLLDEMPGDYNVVVFPYGGVLGVSLLNWAEGDQGYQGVEPLGLLTRRPVLTSDAAAPYLKPVVNDLASGGVRAVRALKLLNARYVVLHFDAKFDRLYDQDRWLGRDVNTVDDRLESIAHMHLVFATDTLRVYSWTGWRPFRFFAASLKGRQRLSAGPTRHGREEFGPSVFSTAVRRRPLPYRKNDAGSYVVDATSLQPHELLVMNQPFDSAWRADGARPIQVAPGLTAFQLDRGRKVDVSHTLDKRLQPLLALVPVVLLGCAVSLGWVLLERRRSRPH